MLFSKNTIKKFDPWSKTCQDFKFRHGSQNIQIFETWFESSFTDLFIVHLACKHTTASLKSNNSEHYYPQDNFF